MAEFKHDKYGIVETDFGSRMVISERSETLMSSGVIDLKGKESTFYVNFSLRSIGEINSHVYPLVDCLTEAGDRILSHDSGKVFSGMAKVESIVENTITIQDNPDLLRTFQNHQASINTAVAVFLDGQDTHLPEFVMTVANFGNTQFRTMKQIPYVYRMDQNRMILHPDILIPDHIRERMDTGYCTVRLHHYTGYGHLYPLSYFTVPSEWMDYTIPICPRGRFSEDPMVLPMGTRYIRLGFLANHGQLPYKSALLINKFRVYELL